MTSFTLPSDRRWPRLAATLLAAALLAWGAGAAYSLNLNPEIKVFTAGARAKMAWTAGLDRQFTNKTIIFGGSSSSFSIDPQHALDHHQLPVANLALGAGLGVQVLTRFAFDQARPGDTLIAAFEPTALGDAIEPLQTGLQFSHAMRQPGWASPSLDLADRTADWSLAPAALRPGGYHFFTLLGKFAAGKKIYRYSASDFLPTGQQTTAVPLQYDFPVPPGHLSPAGRAFLITLREHAKQRGCRLAFLLPWQYAPPDCAPRLRRENAAFLREVAACLPVLDDPALGVHQNPAHTADTVWHLNRAGALIRTDQFASAVKHWKLWQPGPGR